MARDAEKNAPVAHVLYAALIVSGRHDVQKVAQRMGIAAPTLYDYCHNRLNFPTYLIRTLFAATRDVELINAIVGGDAEEYLVVLRQTVEPTAGGLERDGLRLVTGVGHVTEKIERATEDGIVTAAEKAELLRELERLQRRAEELRRKLAAVDHGVAAGVGNGRP